MTQLLGPSAFFGWLSFLTAAAVLVALTADVRAGGHTLEVPPGGRCRPFSASIGRRGHGANPSHVRHLASGEQSSLRRPRPPREAHNARRAPLDDRAPASDAADSNDNDLSSDVRRKGLALGIAVPTAVLLAGAVNWWGKRSSKFGVTKFHVRERGWLGKDSYSGGHDKVGHFISNYVMQYAVADMYRAVGYPERMAMWMAAGVTFVAFNIVELVDGYTTFGWEYGDTYFNLAGHGLALLSQIYHLERFFLLRVSWVPSRSQLSQPKLRRRLAIIEDYNGQRHFLIANTASILDYFGVTGGVMRYLAPGFYFDTRGYNPKVPPKEARERNVGAAVVVDFAALLREHGAGSLPGRFGAWLFRYYQPSVLVGYGYDLNHKRWHAPDVSLAFTGRF